MSLRRHSSCHLHPYSAGVCPSCLRSRLSYLKPSDSQPRISLSRLLETDLDRVSEQAEKESDEGEKKTMKEHIDIELEQRQRRKSIGLWSGGAASVFQKWRLKQQNKKKHNNEDIASVEKPVMRRRSCDADTRLASVDDPRCSVDVEPPRASWDGYMIARTIPRLAPMLSVIENAMMNEQMMVEDFESNSVSESSSSQRRNSFDCSSSGKSSSKHRAPVEINHVKSVLPIAKIVVKGTDTGDMGFDLYKDLSKSTEVGFKNADSFKRKMLKILGFKSKSVAEGDKIDDPIEKNNDVGSNDLYQRSPSIGDIRGPAAPFDKNRSVRYSSSPSNFENSLLKFRLAPPERSVLNLRSSSRGVSRLKQT